MFKFMPPFDCCPPQANTCGFLVVDKVLIQLQLQCRTRQWALHWPQVMQEDLPELKIYSRRDHDDNISRGALSSGHSTHMA
ncbi:hypothetical protein Ancab_031919 [Ancistrocladus abbreviatus]